LIALLALVTVSGIVSLPYCRSQVARLLLHLQR
jgi:hypothetical protein